ncbi:hypothetical protein BGZ50_008931 [Haplosporangium sp. Z 11]|nr:hypothetical protein BGZ50_008931 [Haplosporangium sp. Z 11]
MEFTFTPPSATTSAFAAAGQAATAASTSTPNGTQSGTSINVGSFQNRVSSVTNHEASPTYERVSLKRSHGVGETKQWRKRLITEIEDRIKDRRTSIYNARRTGLEQQHMSASAIIPHNTQALPVTASVQPDYAGSTTGVAVNSAEEEKRIIAEVWEAFKNEHYEALSQVFQGMTDQEIEDVENEILQHNYETTDYDPTYDTVADMEEHDMEQTIEHYMRLESLAPSESSELDETAAAMSLSITLLAGTPCFRCRQGQLQIERAAPNLADNARIGCRICKFGLEKESLIYIANTGRNHSPKKSRIDSMQLQAERDHFVHSGIGGGSSSSSSASSPSCSPPKDSLLSLIKVNNLKKPKIKQKEKEKELKERKDVSLAMDDGMPHVQVDQPTISMDLTIEPMTTPSTNPSYKSLRATSSATAPIAPANGMLMDTHSLTNSGNVSNNTCSNKVDARNPTNQQQETLRLKEITTSQGSQQQTAAPSTYTTIPKSISSLSTLATRHTQTLLQRTLAEPYSPLYPCTLGISASNAFSSATDCLSRLPSELFFNVLWYVGDVHLHYMSTHAHPYTLQLGALDLSRVAQVSKFYARMVGDSGVWRVKSIEHPLFSDRHVQGRRSDVPWLAYYKFLHQSSLIVKQNWQDARPQSVHVLEGHTGLISSQEMTIWTLVTASTDSTVRVWDLRTLQCIQVLRSKQALTCVSQSERAGAACARTSFGALCIWDIRTGELILQDDSAMPAIASFMYMDERYIGYGQCDGVVTIFDWSSRKELEVVGTYQAHEGDVIHISIRNHKYVISASTNGETLVYSLPQSCIIERILLPHATQAIQFTPTIHDDKVMFSTRDAVYEYELMLGHLPSGHEQKQPFGYSKKSHAIPTDNISLEQHEQIGAANLMTGRAALPGQGWSTRTAVQGSTSNHSAPIHLRPPLPSTSRTAPSSGRVWKPSNSLLAQIRQRVACTGKAFDSERQIIPTRFPRLASIYCLPRTCHTLDHGTTSARDSYGVFMPSNCTHLDEMSVYTRATKQVKQIHGPAVSSILSGAPRNRYYTTMECNQHYAVVASGEKIYVISFLPPGI